ncbi:TPA: Na/Pi cotransporter family protein, partial [Candidatus Poribacteria bacterium]|nr:Na/Pi cotransporter family protein [Candidatus Poribacteria bacterium]HEX28645.1 Na/Pi cotransporter family protein [Candidatus Poribacteria bacterium]
MVKFPWYSPDGWLSMRGNRSEEEDMTQVFTVLGGLALFIYGVQLMGQGLQKAAGDRMRRILGALTVSPLTGTLVGAFVTAIIQSSSATTVMVVGFVNAGLMTLKQAVGVIFGANIGTTITAQLIAFKLTKYALPIVTIGFVMNFVGKRDFIKYLGQFFIGFGILFLGLQIMTSVTKPLAHNESVKRMFIIYSHNRFLGVIIGFAITAIVQSSSATVGLVQTLAGVGLIDLRGAIPL